MDRNIDKELNSDTYGTTEVQEYILPILKHIDNLCRKNGIKYSLAGGCLLGAIRHSGFVPWDDDADVIFDRNNYNKFLRVFENNRDENYILVNNFWVKRITKSDNPRLKQEEGCVDLFVLDNVPDNVIVASAKHLTLKCLQGMIKGKPNYAKFNFGYKVLSFCTYLLGLFFKQETKLKMYDKVSQWGNGKNTTKINNYATYFNMISKIKYNPYLPNEFVDITFEGETFMVFKEYDHALTIQFGDYNKLPPMEDRVPKHLKRDC